jgi:hypothetical protein
VSAADDADAAIARGDFAEARRLARAAAASSDEKERDAGRAVLRRLAPDPVVIALAAGCALLFVYVLLFWIR